METQQGLVRTLRHFAVKLGAGPDHDPDAVELIHAFNALADLAESASSLPAPHRLNALMMVMEKALVRLG